ncbi:hypothetical protein BGY98DRAFT_206828 [Russula aff. rugulosa BPL654]|nr:hypothetical protein BGY98DRAFT_206828 [Russula aff. rugulosa BPL654]
MIPVGFDRLWWRFRSRHDQSESMQIFSGGDGKEDDGDTESIKASMLAYRRDTLVEDSPAAMQSWLRLSNPLPCAYESQAIQVEPSEEPHTTPLSASPGPTPNLFLLRPPNSQADFYSNWGEVDTHTCLSCTSSWHVLAWVQPFSSSFRLPTQGLSCSSISHHSSLGRRHKSQGVHRGYAWRGTHQSARHHVTLLKSFPFSFSFFCRCPYRLALDTTRPSSRDTRHKDELRVTITVVSALTAFLLRPPFHFPLYFTSLVSHSRTTLTDT